MKLNKHDVENMLREYRNLWLDIQGNCIDKEYVSREMTYIERRLINLALFSSTKRGLEWIDFAHIVLGHIDKYTVKQYGDAPNDQVQEWTVRDCVLAIKKYANRSGNNARGGAEELRDLVKIAHYACLAHMKMIDVEADESEDERA